MCTFGHWIHLIGTFIGELDGGGISYLRRFSLKLVLLIVVLVLLFLILVLFILIIIILLHSPDHHCTGCREVEETGLLSESDRMLSKTILVPGANHAQVFQISWSISIEEADVRMINTKVSSGSIPEDVIDNDIDPELTEEEAHQVWSQWWF